MLFFKLFIQETTSWLVTVSMVESSILSGNRFKYNLRYYTYLCFRQLREVGITVSFVNGTDPESVGAAITNNTKLVWLEVCSNPSLQILDVKKTVERYYVRTGYWNFK